MKHYLFANTKISLTLLVLFIAGFISGCDQNIATTDQFSDNSLRLLYQTKVPAGYTNISLINTDPDHQKVYLETGENEISVIEQNGDHEIFNPECSLLNINQQLAFCESGIISLATRDFRAFPGNLEKSGFTTAALGPLGRLVYLYDSQGYLTLTDSGWGNEASDDNNLLLWKKGRETIEVIAGHGKSHLGTIKLAGKLVDLEIIGEHIFVLYLSEARKSWGIEIISVGNYKRAVDLIEEKLALTGQPRDFAVSYQDKAMVIFTGENTAYFLNLNTIEYIKTTLPWNVDYVISLQNNFFAWSNQNHQLHQLTDCN